MSVVSSEVSCDKRRVFRGAADSSVNTKMSETRSSGFFRPWRVSEAASETTEVIAADRIFHNISYNQQRDDDESIVSSSSSTTPTALPMTDGHLLDESTADSISSSVLECKRTCRSNESSDDVGTRDTPSLQDENVAAKTGSDKTNDSHTIRSRQPTRKILAEDANKFDVSSNDVYPLEYLSTFEFPQPGDFVQISDATYATSFAKTEIAGPSSAVDSMAPCFFSSLSNFHRAVHPSAVHTEIYREVQSAGIYSGILSPGFYNRTMEEAVQLVHRQDVAAKQMKKMRPKKFRCQHCDMAFSNNGQLKGHVRIHTGERPFKCDVESCGKSFTRNEELTRHKRIHTGIRPHSCVACGKRFGRKDHLKKHTRTHEVRDPYRVSAAALSVFALGHPFHQTTELPPYVYQI